MSHTNFSQYKNFEDFCKKNNCTPEQGYEILKTALEKLAEKKN